MNKRRAVRPVLYALGLVLLWLAVGGFGGPYTGKLAEVQENDNAAFLPNSAEATQVNEMQKRFHDTETLPAVVVYERKSGITPADMAAVRADVAEIAERTDADPRALQPIPSKDGTALQVIVPLQTTDPEVLAVWVADIRDVADGTKGLTSHVAGPAGIFADFGEAFGELDGLLLVVAAIVVTVILVLVYRSPILPLVVLGGAVFALGLASVAVYYLAKSGTLDLNGQSQGILFVLSIGATTDYALLLVARFREELRRHESRFTAIWIAWRRSLAPIVASAGTVILGLLSLLVSDLNSNRGLGPVGAFGIAASMLVALTFLPGVLALLGRVAFWPLRPAYGTDPVAARSVWSKVASLVGRRPRATWIVTALALLGCVAFVPQLKADGIAQSDLFLTDVDSVVGQEVLGDHFPAGSGSPAVIVALAHEAPAVVAKTKAVDGIAEVVAQPKAVDGYVEIQATLADASDSKAAERTVERLRTDLDTIDEDIQVGGFTAINLDTRKTSERDRTVIFPLVLLVIFFVLALLLRSLVAPLVLVGTVVLSFAATLGVAAVVFNNVFDFPGSDPSVALFGFVFLVALGIDYNIFLMTRVREETFRRGTREGTLQGLRVTGGVITSAGVVLAATFTALGVLPILFLAQIAFIVAFGVLLDTFVVRSLLVPSLTVVIGRRIWWPSRLSHRQDPAPVRVPAARAEAESEPAEAPVRP